MNRQRFNELCGKFPTLRIAVVGDFFLDKWLEIDRTLDETSVETGLTAYQVVTKRLYAGAAGTVLSDLAALEVGKLHAIGFIGDDGEGFEMGRLLKNLRIDTEYLIVSDKVQTPTYTKPAYRENGAVVELNRLDHKNTALTPPVIEQGIIDVIWKTAPRVDAIIALDQLSNEGCGVLTPRVREELAKISAKHPRLILSADSRANIQKFRNMIIKCNNLEALRIFYGGSGKTPEATVEEARKCLSGLSKMTGNKVFISCGAAGVLAQGPNGEGVLLPAVPVEGPIDIVGAGDACTSGIVTTLCAGGSAEEAAFMGNLASSVTIQVIGTTGTATRKQLAARFDEFYKD
jgi:bifunctional ADP-heptose synthase (sugar kinase/adenylyltransferase)